MLAINAILIRSMPLNEDRLRLNLLTLERRIALRSSALHLLVEEDARSGERQDLVPRSEIQAGGAVKLVTS